MVNHIKLYEIAATARNFEAFKAKYGKDVSDEQLKSIFDRFTKQQSRLQIKDIFKYASLKDLTSALETKSGKEVEKSIKTSEANILVDNEKMMIVEPLSMAASLKYGANTKWCTTYSDPEENKFEEYFSKVTLVYFIDKIHNTKYAIAYDKKNPDAVEAFDEKDKSIDFSNVLKFFSVTLEEISSKTISSEQKIKLNQDNFRKEIEKQIVGDAINGNINLFNKKLTKITDIFDFSKYKVVGNFHCSNNQLTSLVGAPREVGGNFYCDENKLTSLKGSPEKVGKNFHCSKNQLTTLEGSPEKVGWSFICNNNQLTSLVGAPKEVAETFNCARNQLTSLEGSPKKVGVNFYCDVNQLTSLVGAPVEVGKTFSCEYNKLTSLSGAPEKVGMDFYCRYNQLTSLVGVPKKVGGFFNCQKNPTEFSKEDIQKAMKGDVSEIFIQKENNMDKIPAYYSFYTELITEGHCIMADVPQKESMLDFIKKIPTECVYEEAGKHYGKENNPHVTVMYGLSPVEEGRVKELLTKVPKKIVAELGQISKFENADAPYDVLKIEVKSPHLNKIHEMIRKNFDNNYQWPEYNPHVTLAYVKKGTCNEYVGNKTFEGMKVMFETFMYSNGDRDQNHAVPMKEYNVGTSGGYGGGAMAGGPVAPTNWAGTQSTPQTSRRLKDYPASRRYTYMQGNTIIGNSLYDTITRDDLTHQKFTPDEMFAGFRAEMKKMEYPDKDVARPIIVKNLESDPKYYSDLKQYFNSDK
jgi:2'-5' RNA ligase